MLLGYSAEVPGNASRFFKSESEALSQRIGQVNIGLHNLEKYVYNTAFDADLIKHDGEYLTTTVNLKLETQIPTLSYFSDSIAPLLSRESKIIDIGCGQGELVKALEKIRGGAVVGYDPVLKTPGTNLIPKYWTVDDEIYDLYIMRCVLPHLEDPWSFLDSIANASPGALLLVEYQRLEWIFANEVWYQISHDHVNLFREEDFRQRFEIVASGIFGNHEWQWVLLRVGVEGDFDQVQRNIGQSTSVELAESFSNLAKEREKFLESVLTIDKPIAIWGTAGKGIVLAHSIASIRDQLDAIDAGPDRWGLYLEGSGTLVKAPEEAMQTLHPETTILVVNPNHYDEISSFVAGRFSVELVSNLSRHLHD